MQAVKEVLEVEQTKFGASDVMKSLVRICEKVTFAFYVIAGILLIFMTLLVTFASITRYGFNAPIASTVDITGFILYFVTFLSAPWILKQDKHVNVDILKEFLTIRKQKFLDIVNTSIMFLCSTLIFVYGVYLTYDQFIRAEKLYGALEIPKYTLTVVIPISGLLLIAMCLIRLVESVDAFRTCQTVVRKGK